MRALRSAVLLALICFPGSVLGAQGDSARTALTKPPPMINRGDLLKLAATGAVTFLAYQVDGPVRDATHGDGRNDEVLDALERFGDIYSYGGAVGVGGAMWVGGLMTENRVVATTGLRALEGIFAAGVVTKTIKGIAGRARPLLAPHEPDGWEFGRGFGTIDGVYESFPSGHATIVFAFASAVTGEVKRSAPQHLGKVAVATYGLAVVTAYSRLHADEHWLSDITMGAGIGVVSGWAVTRWHATRPDNWVDRFFLRPVIAQGPGGATRVGLTIETR